MAETWLYNPWVIAIGSGIVLLLFEEMISAYKKSIFSSATLATNRGSLLWLGLTEEMARIMICEAELGEPPAVDT